MTTPEIRGEMDADREEIQRLVTERIQTEGYRGQIRQKEAVFPWFPPDKHEYKTSRGNRWIASCIANERKDAARLNCNRFIYACLCECNNGTEAYLNMYGQWRELELTKLIPHFCSRFYARGNHEEKHNTELLYQFFEHNRVFHIGLRNKRDWEEEKPGDEIFMATVDGVGLGRVEKDGKLIAVDTFLSYEQAYEDQSMKFARGELTCKLVALKNDGNKKLDKDWRLFGHMARGTLDICGRMKEMTELYDDFRQNPYKRFVDARIGLFSNQTFLQVHSHMNDDAVKNLRMLTQAADKLPDDLRKEFVQFASRHPLLSGQTPDWHLGRMMEVLTELEKLFGTMLEREAPEAEARAEERRRREEETSGHKKYKNVKL